AHRRGENRERAAPARHVALRDRPHGRRVPRHPVPVFLDAVLHAPAEGVRQDRAAARRNGNPDRGIAGRLFMDHRDSDRPRARRLVPPVGGPLARVAADPPDRPSRGSARARLLPLERHGRVRDSARVERQECGAPRRGTSGSSPPQIMCGILGQFSFGGEPPDVDRLRRLIGTLRHRGPDGGAWWSEGEFFLGHRRLAIIDLTSAGVQPMTSDDGSLVVTFNGEIYNYIELREELRSRGRVFVTNTDTEVLLHGYREWGAELPRRLKGMFAFAIVDRRRRELFLARDRFGEKPLFYVDTPNATASPSALRPPPPP